MVILILYFWIGIAVTRRKFRDLSGGLVCSFYVSYNFARKNIKIGNRSFRGRRIVKFLNFRRSRPSFRLMIKGMPWQPSKHAPLIKMFFRLRLFQPIRLSLCVLASQFQASPFLHSLNSRYHQGLGEKLSNESRNVWGTIFNRYTTIT